MRYEGQAGFPSISKVTGQDKGNKGGIQKKKSK